MTPVELNIYARANERRLRDNQEAIQGNNYMLAAMIRGMIWGKNAPKYEECFPENQQEMDDEQMFAIVKGLNSMLGGKEV